MGPVWSSASESAVKSGRWAMVRMDRGILITREKVRKRLIHTHEFTKLWPGAAGMPHRASTSIARLEGSPALSIVAVIPLVVEERVLGALNSIGLIQKDSTGNVARGGVIVAAGCVVGQRRR